MNGLIGKELGPYRVLEQIGAGGMATVYKAYHAAMDRYVAVKVLPEQMGHDADLRKRFQREAKVIARLEHAHVLPVYDYGRTEDRLYLVMRYVQAGTLKDRITTGPVPLDEMNHILRQVGGALQYAHRMGVVHRDVKPTNVLLDAQGDCYLTDFGLARIMQASVQLTATGVGVGTPAYMSPEQGQGDKVDARSDIYSLGVMLYEMATGQVPYQAETPMAVVLKHITAAQQRKARHPRRDRARDPQGHGQEPGRPFSDGRRDGLRPRRGGATGAGSALARGDDERAAGGPRGRAAKRKASGRGCGQGAPGDANGMGQDRHVGRDRRRCRAGHLPGPQSGPPTGADPGRAVGAGAAGGGNSRAGGTGDRGSRQTGSHSHAAAHGDRCAADEHSSPHNDHRLSYTRGKRTDGYAASISGIHSNALCRDRFIAAAPGRHRRW